MLKKLVALGALSAALVAVPATSASADDNYAGGPLPTETIIEVQSDGPGKPVTLFVSATANFPTPPEGDIAVELLPAGSAARTARAVAAAPLLSTTVHFVDEPVAIAGPSLPEGRYLVTAEFTPDDPNQFLPSDASLVFRLAEDGDTDDGEDLPNTGGPNMMWLLLGGGLLAAGAGGVTYGRRREDATV
ncbi:LPXTG cell wall anchor domain-containing protein [Nocardioides caeni]|uniref:LPXTG cell wall anchor domain-containing protein n=1 Tax=Nocardioides caeni TaxID=574700 RepID=UPI0031ED5162